MAIKEETLRLNFLVEGDQARKKILDLNQSVEKSNASIRAMRKEREMLAKQGLTDTERYKQLTQSIKAESDAVQQNKEKLASLQQQLSVENMTIAELTSRTRQLSIALSKAVPGTDNFKNLQSELTRTKERLHELKGQSGNTGTALKGITSSITKAFGVVGVAVAGVKKLFQTVSGGIQTIAGFEQANANLATILGQNINTIFDLTRQAQELGKTTQYTASQVTGLQTELAKEKTKLFEEEALAESTNAEKKIAAENKRYEAEKKMFEGHEDALEAIEKKHLRLMFQIQMEGQNDSFARMQTQHELERADIENFWKAKIAVVRAGSGEALDADIGRVTRL